MGALAQGLRPRVWFFVWAVSLIPMAAMLIPFAAALAPDLLHQPKGREIWHSDSYVFDVLEPLWRHRGVLAAVGGSSLLLTLLLAPLVSGAVVAALRHERVIAGAARDYGRQLRFALLGLLPLLLAAALSAPAFVWLDKATETAIRQTPIDSAQLGALALAALLFLFAFTWIECGRLAMVKAVERMSAWRAFATGTRYFFRHFLRVIPRFALPVVLAFAGALGLMVWRAQTQYLWLGHLVPLLFAWSRTARLAALRTS